MKPAFTPASLPSDPARRRFLKLGCAGVAAYAVGASSLAPVARAEALVPRPAPADAFFSDGTDFED